MASPNATFTEMVTTTLRSHPSEVSDNVSLNNALYRRLKSRGKIKKLSGGYEIVRPLDLTENATYQRYSGYDSLNIAASEVLTAVKFDWMQAAVHVTASGRELRQNAGKEQIIDLAEARLTNAMRTAANNMSVDLYSDGALANQMGGLSTLIQTNGQGTIGGIASATFTQWRNQFREISGTTTWTKSTIRDDMNALWYTCVRGNDKPDLIVSSQDFYAAYEASLQDLQRYATSSEASAGFNALKYKSADIIFDSNTNFTATAERMYYLNTDYLELCVHRDADWAQMDDKFSVNQDGVVIPIIWQGNLVVSNRALQGILIDAS